MEEINLSQLVIYQQEEQQRKNKVKRKVLVHVFHADPPRLTLIGNFWDRHRAQFQTKIHKCSDDSV